MFYHKLFVIGLARREKDDIPAFEAVPLVFKDVIFTNETEKDIPLKDEFEKIISNCHGFTKRS